MKSLKKVICFIISLLLAVSLVVGCESENSSGSSTDSTTSSNNEQGTEESTSGKETKDITLTYWVPMHSQAVKILQNYGESEVYKELEKRTGIKIKFLHPPSGQASEQLNLMISSKDLPDIIESFSYPGGLDKAIEDGIIIRLNELIDKYAPNYKALRESNPDIAAETMTDSGNIGAFYCIQTEEEPPWLGLIIRQDYLDDLGLEMPRTIADWENTLRAFKDMGVEAPLYFNIDGWELPNCGVFVSAYGGGPEFYNDNGQVKYGPIEPGYKDFIALISKWYQEGLIDKDFATRDDKNIESMIVNGEIGSWVGAYESFDYYASLTKDNPKFKLAPAPSPVLNEGDKVEFRQKNYYNKGTPAVITTKCKYPEEAVKWFDYHYSEEGSMLFNWGIEGVSYKMLDGKPQYTDLILNNPEGLSYITLAYKYKIHMGPYLRDYKSYPMTDIIIKAMEVWGKAGSSQVLPMTTMTLDESKEYSEIMSDINTYIAENRIKFVMGVEPISNFDAFVEQIKKMGIERAIEIQQAALDRYNDRRKK